MKKNSSDGIIKKKLKEKKKLELNLRNSQDFSKKYKSKSTQILQKSSEERLPMISKTPTKGSLENSLSFTKKSFEFKRKSSFTKSLPNSSVINNEKPSVAQAKLGKKIGHLSQIVAKVNQKQKEDYLSSTLISLRLVKTLPPVDMRQLKEKRKLVSRVKGWETRKTVIFDLDETLVHCCKPGENSEIFIEILLPNGSLCQAGINIRPFALKCLTQLSQFFEIFIFTASQSCYANAVCNLLDPNQELIHQRFYRDHCINMNEILVKDLRIFANRKVKNMVVVENSIHCMAYQLDNCIPIVSWFDNYQDNELEKIMNYVMTLKNLDDLRTENRKVFKLAEY